MAKTFLDHKRVRKDFGRIESVIEMPNLVEVQKNSYSQFLQMDAKPEQRVNIGLQEVFTSSFPIRDFSGHGSLEFVKYEFDEPKYDVNECLERGMTYAAPLKATLRLIVWDVDETTGARSVRDIKEQEVYMGDMPLMTENATFICNGIERVVVSQMHRSPGVFFDHDDGKTHSSGKFLFNSRVIPYRGSWLDFEFDPKDIVYVRIDRRRKLPVTTLLYCLDSDETEKQRAKLAAKGQNMDPRQVQGLSQEDMLSYFYDKITYTLHKKEWETTFNKNLLRGSKLAYDMVDADTGKVVAKVGEKMNSRVLDNLEKAGIKKIIVHDDELVGRFAASDMINPETGEIWIEVGQELTKENIENLHKNKVKEIQILNIDYINVGPYIRNTMMVDKNTNREEALIDVYKVMRPGEPPTLETADVLFRSLFFDHDRYDLSPVGRVKINARLDVDYNESPEELRILTKKDILKIVKILVDLKDGRGTRDDIDHLGNRRVRSVGELMENAYRIGIARLERTVRERMSSIDIDSVMPQDLVNAKPAAASIREFFESSQLSPLMDQKNPLSEVVNKRRLSALGLGGITRERAGFEVRDIHPSHYGRICPIETPEGQNVGLITQLATYAKVNKYGFIETPYRKVKNGKVTKEVVYLSALEEGKYVIAQANAPIDAKTGAFIEELVNCRQNMEFMLAPHDSIDFIDVSPKQIVSVSSTLIPFLGNDDSTRALMGANMQRQAVPLLCTEAPFVGTGMERTVAKDSGAAVTARRGGIVQQVDASRIVIKVSEKLAADDAGVDIYTLQKFKRTNDSTCINQKPLVKVGDELKSGDIIADGHSTDMGELALGRNLLVAFMPWNGYNYEDAILISERIVSEDIFTSIHIENFSVEARDTKLGQEEITRDIPNVGEDSLKQLDEVGIVHIGAEVKANDILVGKVSPKGESLMTPEEKLLRAIFGEKAADVRDTSLRVPPGSQGTVVEVRVFNRRGVEKDERSKAIERMEIDRLVQDRDDVRIILEESFYTRMKDLLIGHELVGARKGSKSSVINDDYLEGVPRNQWKKIAVKDDKVMQKVEALTAAFDEGMSRLKKRFESKVEKIQAGADLPPGVLKKVKVFVASKRKLQPGDKLAGRHGNKGIVSRVLPVEDMPFAADGTPMDIVLNPLGIPSRMNIGQLLETHLGWASKGLGKQIGAIMDNINAKKGKMDDVRDKLLEIYGQRDYDAHISDLTNAEIKELATNLSYGVPFATPAFDGATDDDMDNMLEMAGLDKSGQITLYDGRSGEPFERKVTVGYIYMMKLDHLVDDKIHARSVGPYSLVTQQPLGGKAQFGGQRFGEMEVWALEAYGAAYTLQEILTVKSDDTTGRTKVYESIVRGDDSFITGIPESFNVLVKELRSLGLNIELLGNKQGD